MDIWILFISWPWALFFVIFIMFTLHIWTFLRRFLVRNSKFFGSSLLCFGSEHCSAKNVLKVSFFSKINNTCIFMKCRRNPQNLFKVSILWHFFLFANHSIFTPVYKAMSFLHLYYKRVIFCSISCVCVMCFVKYFARTCFFSNLILIRYRDTKQTARKWPCAKYFVEFWIKICLEETHLLSCCFVTVF